MDTLEIFDNFYLWRATDTGAEPPCVVDSNVERILHVFREPLSQRLREEGGQEASLEDGGVMVHKKSLTIVAMTPMMKTGAGSQKTLVRSRSRAVIPPILATKEQIPTAWFLTVVGNSSAV